MTKVEAQDFLETVSKTKIFQSRNLVHTRIGGRAEIAISRVPIKKFTPAFIHTMLDNVNDMAEVSMIIDNAEVVFIDIIE